MDTIRTFIAVEIDSQTGQKISELVSILKKSNADIKWITDGQMHLTLKFLGNIDKDKVRGISEAISNISDNFNSFKIAFSKIGAFPSLNHPAVIWLGIDKGAESLKTLNEKIETALEKLGFERESHEFKPHLTLGRVRSDKNMPNITKLLKEMEPTRAKTRGSLGGILSGHCPSTPSRVRVYGRECAAFYLVNDIQIDKLTLFQSDLNPKGAIYSIILQKYLQNS